MNVVNVFIAKIKRSRIDPRLNWLLLKTEVGEVSHGVI